MTTNSPKREDALAQIVEAIRTRRRFVLSSHSRPDGDSIGSQLAMAFALDALGKDSRIINADRAPDHFARSLVHRDQTRCSR